MRNWIPPGHVGEEMGRIALIDNWPPCLARLPRRTLPAPDSTCPLRDRREGAGGAEDRGAGRGHTLFYFTVWSRKRQQEPHSAS